MQQRQASPHTIASYRDTFRLLLQFAQQRLRKAPSALALEDIDAPLVVAFLDELEATRGITARTRNLRLTAIHSFFRYVAFEAPAHAAQMQRVLAIPAKRFTRALVPFLSRRGRCLAGGAGSATWSGRRDHALMLLAVQTGLRLSELTGLRARGCAAGRRRACARDRQGAQGALHAAEQEHAGGADRVDARAAEGAGSAGVPQRARRTLERARRALPAVQARRCGSRLARHLKRKRVSPHVLAAHDGDGPAAGRRRAARARAVARP